MATIGEITSASSYTGNVGLGGGTLGAFQLDVKPLQDMAAYTFAYNKRLYDDKQKQIEAAAKEMASLTQYDLNLAPKKDRDAITKEWQELYTWVRNNPDSLDFMNHQDKWLEYNEKRARFEDKLNGGKARTALYNIREKEIADTTNAELKTIRKRKLDEEVTATDLLTPLKHSQAYDLAQIAIKPAARKTFDVTKTGYDYLSVRTMDMPDMASVNNQANALGIGMVPPDQQPDWSTLSPEAQKQKKLEWEEQVASGRTEPIETTKAYNAAWNELKTTRNKDFFNDDGTVKTDAVLNSGINPISSIVGLAETFNQKMRDMKGQISAGYFQDQFGKPINFGPGGLNIADYAEINVKDGLTVQEYNKLKIFAASEGAKYKTKTDVTELGLKREKLALEQAKGRAYIDEARARTKKLNKELEKDAVLEDLWTENIVQQKSLIVGGGGNKFATQIQAGSSNPMLKLKSDGTSEQIIPFGAKVVWNNYVAKTNEKGEYLKGSEVVDNASMADRVPAQNAKVLYTIGGHYNMKWVSKETGRAVGQPELNSMYADYKDRLKKKGHDWTGSYDDFLKIMVQAKSLGTRIEGENGETDEKQHNAALKAINKADVYSNLDFSEAPDYYVTDLGEGSVESESRRDKKPENE